MKDSGLTHNLLSYSSIDFFASPQNNLFEIIKDALDKANENIYVMHSIFRDKRILQSLLEATARGVKVRILVNKNDAAFFYPHRNVISVKAFTPPISRPQLKLHQKVILIDKEIVLCGSVNLFDRSLDRDHESLLKIKSQAMSDAFLEEFNRIRNCFGIDIDNGQIMHANPRAIRIKALIKKTLRPLICLSLALNALVLIYKMY